MRTVYTGPRGNADVVVSAGFHRVRIRVRGQWRMLPTSYLASAPAMADCDRADSARAGRGER